jgi:hypothetical protein
MAAMVVELCYWERLREEERETEPERGEKGRAVREERGGVVAFLGSSRRSTGKQEVALVASRASRRWRQEPPGSSTQLLRVPTKKTKKFANSPLALVTFQGKNGATPFCMI